MKEVFKFIIRIYQKGISPFLPSSCRFYPTCSHYSYEAFDKYGAIKGFWLSIKRISKCHPFHPGGIDYVPEPRNKNSIN